MIFQSLTGSGSGEGGSELTQRVARCHDRPDVDQPGVDEPDDVRVDTVHAPRELDREALAAGQWMR